MTPRDGDLARDGHGSAFGGSFTATGRTSPWVPAHTASPRATQRRRQADLVTANYRLATVSVLLGNGDGTFQPRSRYATGAGPIAVAVADFNGDGKLDLVVAN